MDAVAAETIIAWEGHEGVRVARTRGFDIVDCGICGFKHALPLPCASDMAGVYREEYYASEKPTFLTHAREDQSWAELAQNDRLDVFERLLPSDQRRLLDIGSGPGYFLKAAMAHGWNATGIEPSRQAAAHARSLGAKVVEGFFEAESAERLGIFDAIHLNNVLEHIPDPIALLTLAARLLESGGVLCINVPNDFSALQIAGRGSVNSDEWWIAPPHHLNYFDFDSLGALVERLGFRVVERQTSFPMEAFLMMGEDYTRDPILGRTCHNKRKRFDLAFESAGLKDVRRAFYRALAEIGLGREAVVIAVKA